MAKDHVTKKQEKSIGDFVGKQVGIFIKIGRSFIGIMENFNETDRLIFIKKDNDKLVMIKESEVVFIDEVED